MNSEALLRQYVDTGLAIDEYQFNKLTPNLKKTYIRKRNIALESGVYDELGRNSAFEYYELDYISDKAKIEILKVFGGVLGIIKNPTDDMVLASIENDCDNIMYIKNPSEELQIAAIMCDSSSIKFIKNPTEKVQLIAVKKRPYSIQFIHNPSEQVQLAAVQTDGLAIDHILHPSEKAQIIAIKQNESAYFYIKNPTDKAKQQYSGPYYHEYIGKWRYDENVNENIKRIKDLLK